MQKNANINAMNKLMTLFSNKNFWTKGVSHKTRKVGKKEINCYCLSGGINMVASSQRSQILNMMAKAIASYTGKYPDINNPNGVVINFNDRRSTTFDDIQAILRITKTFFEVRQSAKA